MIFTTNQATLTDIALIRELANEIWHEYYPAIITNAQINYMLDLMYSEKKLASQLNSNHTFHIIKKELTPIGFIGIEKLSENKFYLQKYYLLPKYRGLGIGQKMLDNMLTQYPIQSLKLAVNRQNYKSINFYFKLGFKIIEVVDNAIGENYYMNDFIMEKTYK